MYGHTHRPYLEQGGKVTILNPGSLSYPRQEGHRPSYMIMELDKDGTPSYHTCYPVSYTHLDVYKRQGDSHAASIGTDCSNYVVCRRPAQMIFLFLCHRKLRSMT